MPTEADWNVMARLFAPEDAAFRHSLGLFRSEASEFYAPTAHASAIQTQKREILESAGSDKYLFDSEDGLPAFEEFTRVTCRAAGTADTSLGRNAINRATTLALEPDWVLLSPPDWKMVWASVCFPTRWTLVGKGLRPLPEIHAPVPSLNEELGRKIDLFFGRLVPGEGWGRANWGLSSSAALNQHPSLPYTALRDETPLGQTFLRVESQHLLKMPETGAIAFGIRILSFALDEVLTHESIARGLKERLRTMPIEIAAYKGISPDFWRRL